VRGGRQAVLEANRLVWLVGATAFLNDCAPGSWGDMLDLMHKAPPSPPIPPLVFGATLLTGRSTVRQEYAPTFRAAYLREFGAQQQQQQ
jgi:hypothetical protein